MLHLNDSEKELIVRLRFLISRAAQSDSLGWWNDGSLTQEGLYLLERTYPFAPENAGRRLALAAAAGRYAAAFETDHRALHLFHLDFTGVAELAMRSVNINRLDLPSEPIRTLDELRTGLLSLLGKPIDYKNVIERSGRRLEILPTHNPAERSPLFLARMFAWAALEGLPKQAVFPYILDL